MTEKELKEKLDLAMEAYHERFRTAPDGMELDAFEAYMTPIRNVVNNLYQQYRLVQTPTMRELSEYGDHMTIEQFIDSAKEGWFIDYDGSGNYATDKQESNISIYPSDVTSGRGLRKDFTHVMWYNK